MKMQNVVIKHLITVILLLVYINRGFFIYSATEIENKNGEINSVLEFFVEFVTGESNNVDEDGDMQTDCNSVNIVQHDFSQQLLKIETANLFSKNIKKSEFPNKENLPANNYYRQIDQPPELVVND